MEKIIFWIKTFWQKKTILFSVLRILVVLTLCNLIAIYFGVVGGFLPLSMRCDQPRIISGYPENPGVTPVGVTAPMMTIHNVWSEKKCYSLFSKEYWIHQTWTLEYSPLFKK